MCNKIWRDFPPSAVKLCVWVSCVSECECDRNKKSKKKNVQIEMNIMVLNKVSIRKLTKKRDRWSRFFETDSFLLVLLFSVHGKMLVSFGPIFRLNWPLVWACIQWWFPIIVVYVLVHVIEEVYGCEKTPERPIWLNKITIWYNLNLESLSPFHLVSKTLPPRNYPPATAYRFLFLRTADMLPTQANKIQFNVCQIQLQVEW